MIQRQQWPEAPEGTGKTSRRVLKIVQEFYVANGLPVSVRDVKDVLVLGSSSSAHYHLLKLADMGLVAHRPNVARSWVPVTQEDWVASS